MNIKNKILLLFVFILTTANLLLSQTVGLVLSGGGAKGLAHIGVIKALEENDIPIDYVVGTSMGAIVGGLYASGLTPEEMKQLFIEERFMNYYKGRIPDNQYYYFKTTNPNASSFSLGVTKRDSNLNIALPTNLIATQPMDFGVMEYFSKYSAAAQNNFDSLFVPFRCVGSDIYNNQEVVFYKGDLGQSIRASMTYPFYFKPVVIDSVLYFDGGIYNNFPIDVMRNIFKPDIIIGVNVTNYVEKPNPDDLMLQIQSLVMGAKKEYEVPEEEGVTIHVDFKNVGLLDFHKVEEFSNMGYDACYSMLDSIKKRVPWRRDSVALKRNRANFKSKVPEYYFDKIYIKGIDKNSQSYLKNSFRRKQEKLNIERLESDYYKLISDFQIESATPYAMFNDTTGYYDILLDIKKEKRANILFGAVLSSGYSNTGFVGFNYKLLNKISMLFDANLYFGRLYSSFRVGGRFDFPFYIPIALETDFNVNRFDYFKGNSRLFSLNYRPPYLMNYDNNFRIDLFSPLNRKSVIKLGYATGYRSYEYFQVSNFLETDTADYTIFRLNTSHLSIIRDNHNYIQYPTKGSKSFISLRYTRGREENTPGSTTALENKYIAKHSWFGINMGADIYTNITKHFSLGLYMELLASNKSLYRNYASSVLAAPAFRPTPHSKTLFLPNYHANSYAAVGIKPIINLTEKINLRIEGYLFAPFEKILRVESASRVYKPYLSQRFAYLHFLGMAGVVYNTNIGPVAFTVNYYDTDSRTTYFMLHFGYVIFNKRAYDY